MINNGLFNKFKSSSLCLYLSFGVDKDDVWPFSLSFLLYLFRPDRKGDNDKRHGINGGGGGGGAHALPTAAAAAATALTRIYSI